MLIFNLPNASFLTRVPADCLHAGACVGSRSKTRISGIAVINPPGLSCRCTAFTRNCFQPQSPIASSFYGSFSFDHFCHFCHFRFDAPNFRTHWYGYPHGAQTELPCSTPMQPYLSGSSAVHVSNFLVNRFEDFKEVYMSFTSSFSTLS